MKYAHSIYATALALMILTAIIAPQSVYALDESVCEDAAAELLKYLDNKECEEIENDLDKYLDVCGWSEPYNHSLYVATACYKCDIREKEKCARILKEYKPHSKYFDMPTYLKAIRDSDEKNILAQTRLMEQWGSDYSWRDTWRMTARGYAMWGDLDKTIEMLEDLLAKQPKFLRAAADLSYYYQLIGNLDKAEKYAEYYIEGDSKWGGAYHVLAIVWQHRGDMKMAWSFLEEAESRGYDTGLARARFHAADGDFQEARNEYSKIDISYVKTDTYGSNYFDNDVIETFIKLYDDHNGMMPGVEEIEQMAIDMENSGEYYEAAVYYNICRILRPLEPSRLYKLGHALEKADEIRLAVIYYSMFLSLDPAADEKQDIKTFLNSRKTEKYNPQKSVAKNQPAEGSYKYYVCEAEFGPPSCAANNACYWNNSEERCFQKSRRCEMYTWRDACVDAPASAECYWNAGMEKCISRQQPCQFFYDMLSCEGSDIQSKCFWDIQSGKCLDQRFYRRR